REQADREARTNRFSGRFDFFPRSDGSHGWSVRGGGLLPWSVRTFAEEATRRVKASTASHRSEEIRVSRCDPESIDLSTSGSFPEPMSRLPSWPREAPGRARLAQSHAAQSRSAVSRSCVSFKSSKVTRGPAAPPLGSRHAKAASGGWPAAGATGRRGRPAGWEAREHSA